MEKTSSRKMEAFEKTRVKYSDHEDLEIEKGEVHPLSSIGTTANSQIIWKLPAGEWIHTSTIRAEIAMATSTINDYASGTGASYISLRPDFMDSFLAEITLRINGLVVRYDSSTEWPMTILNDFLLKDANAQKTIGIYDNEGHAKITSETETTNAVITAFNKPIYDDKTMYLSVAFPSGSLFGGSHCWFQVPENTQIEARLNSMANLFYVGSAATEPTISAISKFNITYDRVAITPYSDRKLASLNKGTQYIHKPIYQSQVNTVAANDVQLRVKMSSSKVPRAVHCIPVLDASLTQRVFNHAKITKVQCYINNKLHSTLNSASGIEDKAEIFNQFKSVVQDNLENKNICYEDFITDIGSSENCYNVWSFGIQSYFNSVKTQSTDIELVFTFATAVASKIYTFLEFNGEYIIDQKNHRYERLY